MPTRPSSERDSDVFIDSLVAAAHELKTPLGVIAHIAAALEGEAGGLSPAERQIMLQRIQYSAERAIRLVQGLTTSYRLDGQLSLRLEPVNVAHVCEDVAHEMAPFLAQHGQDVKLRLGTRARLAVADRELLRSLMFNLLDNAVRHAPPLVPVDVRLHRHAELVRVEVRDSGPGVGPADIGRLRQRLGRHAQPIVTRGSGLELYIAGQLATAMGGRIGARRTGGGAGFYVDLLHSKQLSLI